VQARSPQVHFCRKADDSRGLATWSRSYPYPYPRAGAAPMPEKAYGRPLPIHPPSRTSHRRWTKALHCRITDSYDRIISTCADHAGRMSRPPTITRFGIVVQERAGALLTCLPACIMCRWGAEIDGVVSLGLPDSPDTAGCYSRAIRRGASNGNKFGSRPICFSAWSVSCLAFYQTSA